MFEHSFLPVAIAQIIVNKLAVCNTMILYNNITHIKPQDIEDRISINGETLHR